MVNTSIYFTLLLEQSRRVFTISYCVSAGERWWTPSKGQYFKPFKTDSMHPFGHSECLNIRRVHIISALFNPRVPLKYPATL